jgi:hypothetical protein
MDPARGKKNGKWKKDTKRGNELSHLLQIKDFTFLMCAKRTGF